MKAHCIAGALWLPSRAFCEPAIVRMDAPAKSDRMCPIFGRADPVIPAGLI